MQTNLLYKIKQAFHSLFSYIDYRRNLLNPIFQSQMAELKHYKDIHLGKRCVIIGNGPSLKNTDLIKIKDEIKFGLNRIYLLLNEADFNITYYVCSNRLVLSQFRDEIIKNVTVPKFTVWEHYDIAKDIPDIHFTYRHNRTGFYPDITKGIWGGATVTYMAMQIAFYMGFHTVILVGVDHYFTTSGTPNKVIELVGDDPNHFSPNYFGKGILWQLPDLETSEYAYTLARKQFEASGREIIDATINGKLKVFPKVDFDKLWG